MAQDEETTTIASEVLTTQGTQTTALNTDITLRTDDQDLPLYTLSNEVVVGTTLSSLDVPIKDLDQNTVPGQTDIPYSYNFEDEPISVDVPPLNITLHSIARIQPIPLSPMVPYGVLQDSNGTKIKKRCRCIEKKQRKVVKEIKYIPLSPAIHFDGEKRNFTCKCSHLRKVVN